MPAQNNPLFQIDRWSAVVLEENDLPQLQRLFDGNPSYFQIVGGQPAAPDEALREFRELPPTDMTFRKKWLIGFTNESGALKGMAIVLADLLAPGVWHTGLFFVATELHGTGAGRQLYAGLEAWMRQEGASWGRLGVVAGHGRAERFWEKAGYQEVRQRRGIPMGDCLNTVRVMVKSFTDSPLADYLELVARDRPETI